MTRYVLYIVFSVLFLRVRTKYLGGTISWREIDGKTRFVYRMTWERGTGPCGPGCSPASMTTKGTLPSNLTAMAWKCTSGCTGSTTLGNINYYVTSVSRNASGWEQGEDQFFHNFTENGPFSVSINSLPWPNAAGLGRMVTTVDLRVRNDTNVSNASPISAVPPTVGIPFGCKSVISLPVLDPDDDTVRCRLATAAECAGACTNLPHVLVNEENCTLTVHTTVANGYTPNTDYRVTVMAEDFPDYTVTVGTEVKNPRHLLSTIPLQFTIKVINASRGCSFIGMEFTSPDYGKSYLRFPYPENSPNLTTSYYIETLDISGTEFLVSFPARLNFSAIPDDRNRTNVTHLYAEWHPHKDQSGDSFFCIWGRRQDGVTTLDRRCTLGYINDINHCNTGSSCKRNGTCVTLYKRYTCKCPHGYKPPDCQERVSCLDFPCKHNSSCADTGAMYKCFCAPGYTGVDCEWQFDPCSSSPCHNNGTCHNATTGFRCACPPQYIGDSCQTRIKVCSAVPCTNGSTCYEKKNALGYECKCPNGTSGSTNCTSSSGKEIDLTGETTESPIWPVVVGVLGGLAVVAAAVAACCWWYLAAAKKQRENNKVDPSKRRGSDVLSRPSSGNITKGSDSGAYDVSVGSQIPVTSHNGGMPGSDVAVNGMKISGAAPPQVFNIYKASANDPLFPSCERRVEITSHRSTIS